MSISRRGLFGLFAGAAATPIVAVLPKVPEVRVAAAGVATIGAPAVNFTGEFFTREAVERLAKQLIEYQRDGGRIA